MRWRSRGSTGCPKRKRAEENPAMSTKRRLIRRRDRSGASALSGRALLHRNALVLEQRLQLAGLEHLADDVAAADELALDIELRDGRPVGIGLDALPQFVVLEDVEPLIGYAEVVEDLHGLAGEAAHRELRRALHEQNDVVSLYFVVDQLVDGHRAFPCWRHGSLPGPRRLS